MIFLNQYRLPPWSNSFIGIQSFVRLFVKQVFYPDLNLKSIRKKQAILGNQRAGDLEAALWAVTRSWLVNSI